MSNDYSRFLGAILDTKNDCMPIWLMRQAGRYLPEYMTLRNKVGNLLSMFTDADIACEITLQPLKRFALDAAIIFHDILLIPHALGMELNYIEGVGPVFTNPIHLNKKLPQFNTDSMLYNLNYLFVAIKQVKQALKPNIPLIGFSGSPFTMSCYMVNSDNRTGKKPRDYLVIKRYLINHPERTHELLEILTQTVIASLNSQIEAGADVVMLFDSWAEVLTHEEFAQFSLPYINKIFNGVHREFAGKVIPRILFAKGSFALFSQLLNTNVHVLGVDWTLTMQNARLMLNNRHAHNVKPFILQGNLNPTVLATSDFAQIKNTTQKILTDYASANNGSYSGMIFNLGHGILPSTPVANVSYLIDFLHEATHGKC